MVTSSHTIGAHGLRLPTLTPDQDLPTSVAIEAADSPASKFFFLARRESYTRWCITLHHQRGYQITDEDDQNRDKESGWLKQSVKP